MNKLLLFSFIICIGIIFPADSFSQKPVEQIPIRVVQYMPNMPFPYKMKDWKAIATKQDKFLYNFNAGGRMLPLIWWDDSQVNFPFRSFGLPANGNKAEILISDSPFGNYVKLLDFVNGTRERRPKYASIPGEYKNLYVKVSTSNRNGSQPDAFEIDAIGITYKTTISPFASGDFVVSFVDLINNSTVPIVAYRPEEVATDLGLYGSSHVGILGGIVSATDVEGILQLDLLKTDYYHPKAYPSYLYYNPYNEAKKITINTGDNSCDLYNTVTSGFVRKGVKGAATIEIPAKGASVIVFVPDGGKMTQSSKKKLVNGVVIDYGNI